MLFKRRTAAGWWERFKLSLWPRVSWRRSLTYYGRRILRLSGTPYAIAMGTAVGAGVAITPFLGFHFLMTFALAWLVRGNMIAGAIGTCIANPLTYPFIWAGTYQIGHLILAGRTHGPPPFLEHEMTHKSLAEILPLIEPMAVGSIPVALAVGFVFYIVVYKTVGAYQNARRQRLAHRRHSAQAAAGAGPRE